MTVVKKALFTSEQWNTCFLLAPLLTQFGKKCFNWVGLQFKRYYDG